MTDSFDYPAAHSMDTAWFAVDADGHVAWFDSGEAGAVPAEAYVGEEYFTAVEQLINGLPQGEAIYVLAGRLGVPASPESMHIAPMNEGPLQVLMFLQSLDPVRAELDAGLGEAVPASEGHGVLFDELPREVHERLHKEGVCRACFWEWQRGEEDEGNVGERGIFTYSHTTDNWVAGPYGLIVRPETPIILDAIPVKLRPRFVRFSGRFADTPFIQPAEHWKCESWEPAWLASDKKTVHPFPGREKEYAEAYQQSQADGMPPLSWTRPPPRRKPWWKFW